MFTDRVKGSLGAIVQRFSIVYGYAPRYRQVGALCRVSVTRQKRLWLSGSAPRPPQEESRQGRRTTKQGVLVATIIRPPPLPEAE